MARMHTVLFYPSDLARKPRQAERTASAWGRRVRGQRRRPTPADLCHRVRGHGCLGAWVDLCRRVPDQGQTCAGGPEPGAYTHTGATTGVWGAGGVVLAGIFVGNSRNSLRRKGLGLDPYHGAHVKAVGPVLSGGDGPQVGNPVIGPVPVYVVHLELAWISAVVEGVADPVGQKAAPKYLDLKVAGTREGASGRAYANSFTANKPRKGTRVRVISEDLSQGLQGWQWAGLSHRVAGFT